MGAKDYVKPTENIETQYRDSGGAPSRECANITAGVGVLTPYARALYVGTTGNVVIETPRGEVVTFTAVPGGTILPTWAAKVTTGTDIVAFYG
jgi:hypothetical protein